MEARQFFRPFITDSVAPAATHAASPCATTLLPVDGVLELGDQVLTLTKNAVFKVACSTGAGGAKPTPEPVIIANNGLDFDQASPGEFKLFDPFYASTFPVCYALAATTVTAYMLVIMLFITPRSFLDGGIVYLGRSGFTNGSSGGVTIGGRPWLQKVAALTVAISLTIATADTFRVAERQYRDNRQNAFQLQLEVMDGTELKAIRLISDTFLWLAQAQTLIRLFPRQREKVIIKWTAFALITLDVIFSALNSFHYTTSGSNGNARPRSFVDAVPALSYLFQLSLGLLYAAWVIYYSLMKKRYAYYHPLMKNMVLVAILSLFSILVPVVFFVLDISKPEFIGWGDYVRWVGAAAASVVVWEWVERIEALEREEKKDGILGREVFDGDEMMEISASEFPWLRRRMRKKNGRDGRDGGNDGGEGGRGGGQEQTSAGGGNTIWPGMTSIATRYRGNQNPQSGNRAQTTQRSVGDLLRPQLWPARPAPAVTPVSRTDTASAASTVYAVRYQPASETTSQTPDPTSQRQTTTSPTDSEGRKDSTAEDGERALAAPTPRQPANPSVIDPETSEAATRSRNRWRSLAQVSNPLSRRGHQEPPAEVLPHTSSRREPRATHDDGHRWDLRARFEDFAATQADKIREKMRPTPETDSLPITVIPAPPRRGAALAQLLEEEESGGQDGGPRRVPLARSSSEGTGSSPFSGAGTVPMGSMERTATNISARSRTVGQQSDSSAPQVTRPPLWPGVQTQHDYAPASETTPQASHPRRVGEEAWGAPGAPPPAP